ncbi:MAG: putative secondary metabolism biosynthetic enzyme [Chrysothrix sp. TS-e1954]|nr:MAG: putative secondary metabolism biosynthetic enzyme [Chrysothrix sp. TS-e1954]
MSTTSYAFGEDAQAHENFSLRVLTKDASFILPYLKTDSNVLDIGCGPGSITCGLAAQCPQGRTVGVDSSSVVLEKARQDAKAIANVEFRHGEIMKGLSDFADGSFDIVFCHQVLVHVADPVVALREMRRLAKPDGGLIAIRESLTVLWHPSNPVLERSMAWMHRAFRAASRADSSQIDRETGTNLPHIWAREAGFPQESTVVSTASGEAVSDREGREQRALGWATLSLERGLFREHLNSAGATPKDIADITEAMEEWKNNPDGWQLWLSSEMIWRK